ncbi:MAG: N-acetylornithine carbamoyltransferase [Candidatus Gracilibacteria bacterium]|jgi:N-acetylornithine carbamoyltransferase
MQHFYNTADFSKSEIEAILANAHKLKAGEIPKTALGKIITLVFANLSLRTRLSFESGMKKLGGEANVLNAGDSWDFEYEAGVVMDKNTQEHISEAARVISRYSDLIGIRNCSMMAGGKSEGGAWETIKRDKAVTGLMQHATVPVINMESNMYHPCQAMADVMTMQEKLGNLAGKKVVLSWAPHPRSLPLATPHSQLLLPTQLGANVTLACPLGYELDTDVLEDAKKFCEVNTAEFKIEHDQATALQDADVVIAKSWTSLKFLGNPEGEAVEKQKLQDWQIKLANLDPKTYFMHCLPIRRNVVAEDAVIDSPNSLIIKEAENRMWAQMAIMLYLLKN